VAVNWTPAFASEVVIFNNAAVQRKTVRWKRWLGWLAKG
jgi:hypothetical protein